MPYNNLIDRTDAAALIPEEVSKEIISGLPKQSAALHLFRQVKMSSKQTRMPVLSALPTAYFVNGDTGLKQTSDLAWQNKALEAEELAVIIPIPEAVLDDAEYDIWGEIKPRVEEALGVAIDAAVFFGTNKPTSWGDSVEDHAAAAGNTFVRGSVAGKDLAHNVNATMKLVESDGYDVNFFLSRKALKADLRDLRDANGGFLYTPSMQVGTPAALYGEEILYADNGAFDEARADLLCGDRTQGIIGLRQDITIKILDQAIIQDNTGAIIYNLAQQDMVAMRVVMRLAWQVPNPVNRMNSNNTTRSPFGVLRPAGFVS